MSKDPLRPPLTSSSSRQPHPRAEDPSGASMSSSKGSAMEVDMDAAAGEEQQARAEEDAVASGGSGSVPALGVEVPRQGGGSTSLHGGGGVDRADVAGSAGGSVGSVGSASSADRRYTLSVVQQPLRSAEFGSSVLSRLPLSPPLIVKLNVHDVDGHDLNIDSTLPFLFSHLSLLPALSANSFSAVDLVSDASSGSSARMLYGTLVSSPHQLKLSPSPRGTYFVFPDVSVRVRGRYRLQVGLMRIAGPPGDLDNPPDHQTLAQVVTEEFEITPLSLYSAPAITALTRTVSQEGVQMFLPRS